MACEENREADVEKHSAPGRAGPRSHIARSPLQYDVLEP